MVNVQQMHAVQQHFIPSDHYLKTVGPAVAHSARASAQQDGCVCWESPDIHTNTNTFKHLIGSYDILTAGHYYC